MVLWSQHLLSDHDIGLNGKLTEVRDEVGMLNQCEKDVFKVSWAVEVDFAHEFEDEVNTSLITFFDWSVKGWVLSLLAVNMHILSIIEDLKMVGINLFKIL